MNKRTYTEQQYQSGIAQHNIVILHTAQVEVQKLTR